MYQKVCSSTLTSLKIWLQSLSWWPSKKPKISSCTYAPNQKAWYAQNQITLMSHVLDGHLCIMSDFIHNQILKDVNVDDTFYKVCKVCTISVQDFFKVEHFFDSILQAKLQTKTQTMVAFYFSKFFFCSSIVGEP